MCNFIYISPNRAINLDQVTDINFEVPDRDGKPYVRIYFSGGGDDLRNFTTVSVEEGNLLRHAIASL